MQLFKIFMVFIGIVLCSIVLLGNEPPLHFDHGKLITTHISTNMECNGAGLAIGGLGFVTSNCNDVFVYYMLYEDGCIISTKDGNEVIKRDG